MSARNRLRAKRQRKRERVRRHLRRMEAQGKPLVKHGICTGCDRRRTLVLPSKLCDRCCEEKL